MRVDISKATERAYGCTVEGQPVWEEVFLQRGANRD